MELKISDAMATAILNDLHTSQTGNFLSDRATMLARIGELERERARLADENEAHLNSTISAACIADYFDLATEFDIPNGVKPFAGIIAWKHKAESDLAALRSRTTAFKCPKCGNNRYEEWCPYCDTESRAGPVSPVVTDGWCTDMSLAPKDGAGVELQFITEARWSNGDHFYHPGWKLLDGGQASAWRRAWVNKDLTAAFAHLGGAVTGRPLCPECGSCENEGHIDECGYRERATHLGGERAEKTDLQNWIEDEEALTNKARDAAYKRISAAADKPVGRESDDPAAAALAEAWASIDGKLDHFRRERDENISLTDPTSTGHYEGYLADASEMIKRLQTRGLDVLPSCQSIRNEALREAADIASHKAGLFHPVTTEIRALIVPEPKP